MSESDTSLGDPQSHKTENFINSSKLIRLNQEVNELKKENSYLLSHNMELNSAFSQLKASIGKNLETTEELRKDMRSKLVKMEHELKNKQDELKEARERITQLEFMNRNNIQGDKSMIENLKSQLSNQISNEIRSLSRSLLDKEISSYTIPSTSKVTSNSYNALSNLIVEAGEVIQDINDEKLGQDQG